MPKLIITEKESVADAIARTLGLEKEKDSYFEGKGYIMSWASGHLIELSEPEDYAKKYSFWTLKDLPIIPETFILKAKKNRQLNTLTKLLKRKDIDVVINACDAGREGELIFRYIYEFSKNKKPVERLWLNALTPEAILNAFSILKEQSEYDPLYEAARCRAESDWLVGMNCTRAFTVKHGLLLSVGRVQTPTLSIIAKRDLEIKSFIPTKFFEIWAIFESKKGQYKGKWKNKEDRLYKEEDAEKIRNKVEGKNGFVKSYTEKEEKVVPPLLFDLGSLQRDASQRFGFSASRTLKIAQSLYENRKLITYPRTDSKYLPTSYISESTTTLKALNISPYSNWVESILKKKISINPRIFNDAKVTDHHAIVPTTLKPDIEGLSREELKLYDLIAKRFISVFLPFDIYNKVNIETIVDGELFITTEKELIKAGWSSIYGKEGKLTKYALKLTKNEEVKTLDVSLEEGITTPPPRLTDGTLISAMESAGRLVEEEELKDALKDKGLGTPATRSQIIERLIEVQYIERDGPNLVVTPKGMEFISLLEGQHRELASPELTAEWEYRLKLIERSMEKRDKFMDDIKYFVNSVVEKIKTTNRNQYLKATVRRVVGICPLCGKEVRENRKAFACDSFKTGCPVTIWKKSYGRNITFLEAEELLASKKIGPLRFRSKAGKLYSAYLILGNEGVRIEFSQKFLPVETQNKPAKRKTHRKKPDIKKAVEEKPFVENNNHDISSGVKEPEIISKQNLVKKDKSPVKTKKSPSPRNKKKNQAD